MTAPLDKDPAIAALLDRLRHRLGPAEFDVVDHWQNDLCAIGIASPRDHRVLAYLSCYDKPEGRYDVELESPTPSGDGSTHRVAGQFSDLDFEALASVVSEHFSR